MKKVFTAFIVLFNFFYLYATPIATLSVGDVILILFVLLLSAHAIKNKTLKISKIGCLICAYIGFSCLAITLFNSDSDATAIILPTARILLYYVTVALFCKEYFLSGYGIKVYKWSAILATLFLFVQMIGLTLFGKYISGNLLGLPLLNKQLDQFNIMMSTGHIGSRARSFFSEPSYYAIYVLLYLAIDLLALKKHDIRADTIITIGLVLSASGTGILGAGVVYLAFFIKNFRNLNKKAVVTIFGVSILAIIGLGLFAQTDAFRTFYERTFVDKTSTNGRFSSYSEVFFNDNDSFAIKVFGRGVEKVDDIYIAGFPRIYYYYGYFGLLIIGILYIYCFKKKSKKGRAVLLLLLTLSFGTEMIFSYMILPYGAFLVTDGNEDEKLEGDSL